MTSDREPPALWCCVGRFLRASPHFPGKRYLANWVQPCIRGKGYATTIRFDRGEKIQLELDDWIASLVFLHGVYEVEKVHTEFFRQAVRLGMKVIDIGAHIGYYTLQAAVRVGESGQVHAFEPVMSTFRRLEANVRMNGFSNVTLNNLALHDRAGTLQIHVAGNSNTGSSSLVFRPADSAFTEKVETLTLDEYVRRKGIHGIGIVKIDVEGSELPVLRGMQKVLREESPQLLVEVNVEILRAQGLGPGALLDYLEGFAYTPWRITGKGPVPVAPGDVGHESLLLFRKA